MHFAQKTQVKPPTRVFPYIGQPHFGQGLSALYSFTLICTSFEFWIEKFYKNYIKTEDFKIKFNKKKEFENYKDILRSKVIIGFSSTMLREAFAFDKKILCVNFANITNIEFPSGGICLLKKDNYDLFEERLKKIESLSFEEYLNEIETVSSIYQRDANTLDYFNQQI